MGCGGRVRRGGRGVAMFSDFALHLERVMYGFLMGPKLYCLYSSMAPSLYGSLVVERIITRHDSIRDF